jgi:hypothetical protein
MLASDLKIRERVAGQMRTMTKVKPTALNQQILHRLSLPSG